MKFNASPGAILRLFGAIGLLAMVGVGAYVYGSSREYTLSELERRFVPGLHGVELVAGTGASFEPWELQEKNVSLKVMLEDACEEAGLERSCANNETTRFSTFTKRHVVEHDGSVFTLVRNATPVTVIDLDEKFIDGRLRLVADWARANQKADGSFPYMYYPSADRYEEDDYTIRQLITVQGLYAIANRFEDAGLKEIAEKAEQQLMEKSYRYDATRGYSYFVEDDGIRLGAAALGILMVREKGDMLRPLTKVETDLGNFLLAMQRDDGSFQTFLQDEPTDLDEKFYSGEALTALARLSAVSDDPRYDEALQTGFEHYREKIKNDFWPQYAPWHMQAYAVYYLESGDDEHAKYVYWLAEGLIQTMLEEDTGAREDEQGRFYNPMYKAWGPPHSSSTGIYLEGIAYAYALAKERGDATEEERFQKALLGGTRALLQVQWTPESAYYLSHPERVVGSFKISLTNNIGRIDQLGHAANALVQVQNSLFGR